MDTFQELRTAFVLESDLLVGVDVDDTLVSWDFAGDTPPHPDCESIEIEFNGDKRKYWVFRPNVQSIIVHKHKGHSIMIWSGSGFKWARTVMLALGLEYSVDLVISKPKWLVDDMMPGDFLPRPSWGAGDPGKCKI